jgi:hypothetical protein
MGSHLWEHTKWVLFYGNKKWVLFYRNTKNGFSSIGTDKLGSLLGEHRKWVLFYGNIENGFSSMGT